VLPRAKEHRLWSHQASETGTGLKDEILAIAAPLQIRQNAWQTTPTAQKASRHCPLVFSGFMTVLAEG
jgi:hypothetical protein